MQILLLDNYDSFTWNLADYLSQCGQSVTVQRNDVITVDAIASNLPDGIVLSPGPGRPETAGIMPELIARLHTKVPILGICLGYQAIGAFFGAAVGHSPKPVHGKTSIIEHNGKGLFRGVPNPTEVMRYHSLNIHQVPDCIKLTAYTQTGREPMALQHKTLPVCGVQFHPESILTTAGMQMLHNWVDSLSDNPLA